MQRLKCEQKGLKEESFRLAFSAMMIEIGSVNILRKDYDMPVKILVLEDDKLFNETLEDFLGEEGYDVCVAMDADVALEMIYERRFDLYLFDVNLPQSSGFELLKMLRDSGDVTPAMFLTSREDEDSVVAGYGTGADDYVRKSVGFRELLLRIEALVRRQSRVRMVKIGGYRLDILSKSLVGRDGVALPVAQKSIDLLIVLVRANGNVVSMESLKDELWAAGQVPSDGALRVYISQLHKYFGDDILNVRGVGYRLKKEEFQR